MHQNKVFSVLVSPLDWGLGHATRCIPIINELIHQGAQVIIAASGSQKMVLNQAFPQLECIEIPGYKIRYKKGFFLKWGLFFGIPSILKQIRGENKWLEDLLQTRKIDAVISDNRYGLYNNKLYSVFVTHQLAVQSGLGRKAGNWQAAAGRLIDRKILKWNYKFISKFSECWVPDFTGNFSLAGLLSNPPGRLPASVKYIGILSRFQRKEKPPVKDSLAILISGPEPQRTQFEHILFSGLKECKLNTVVVRGLPGSKDSIPVIHDWIKIYNHLAADELQSVLNETEFTISRSGYSTIMDLVKMKKNAILVPTPGQTEQEYLGDYLHKKKWMFTIPQSEFDLNNALMILPQSQLNFPDFPEGSLRKEVADLLKKISG